MKDFTGTRAYADYEKYVLPREQRARQLWTKIEAAKAAGLPYEELARERNDVISECAEADRTMERAHDRYNEDHPDTEYRR
jgi:hypothetical protein